MGDLKKNISRHELECKCNNCNVTIQDHEPVIAAWQGACDFFATLHGVNKVSLIVRSGARCQPYNKIPADEGGPGSNDESQHIRCSAIDGDIYLPGGRRIPPFEVYNYFDSEYPEIAGIGLYSWGVHFDTRAIRNRW